jgi:hypothetical protein
VGLLMDVARLGIEGFAAKEAYFLLALNLAGIESSLAFTLDFLLLHIIQY